jgi:Cdc6-like AAA superfamily ATPase
MQALTGEHLSPGVALTHLEELFNSQEGSNRKKGGVTVVLVDEVDLLVTRNQQVRPSAAGPLLRMESYI